MSPARHSAICAEIQQLHQTKESKLLARIAELEAQLAQPEHEPVTLPENKKLILVDSSFDDLMYWLERCESKGHLENCSDLIEPWEKFCDSYCVWTDHHPNCKLAERLPLPAFTTGHCKEKAKEGGCQLHNIQCGFPACDRKES